MMVARKLFLLFIACLLLCSDVAVKGANSTDGVQTYIVHVLPLDNSTTSAADQYKGLEDYYKSFLPSRKSNTTAGVKEEQSSSSSLIYSYEQVISGFAARLTAEELKEMEKKEGFLYACPDRFLQPHTTYTPDFLGLHLGFGLWEGSHLGEGIVIGVLDFGYSPEHPSFKDDGMPPPPSKWKGNCDPEELCNNKVIGVRTFVSSSLPTPYLDRSGHGSHTASTAAGTMVSDASVLGLAKGTASGIAPRAHIAIYKVCQVPVGCSSVDVLAGIDAAVMDGVDVLSLSIGRKSLPFYLDAIAIGAFRAAENGVFVSSSAGNSGPDGQTLSNDAPWILTVSASTTDRELRSIVTIDDYDDDQTKSFVGQTLFQPNGYTSPAVEVVFPSNTQGYCNDNHAFDRVNVTGKIAFCVGNGGRSSRNGQFLNGKGAAGLIAMNEYRGGYTTFSSEQVIPSSHVSNSDGTAIFHYIQSSSKATASITFGGTVFGVSPSPAVASFASRGPSTVNRFIIKPDIIGPGVNIMAAWKSSIMNSATRPPYFNVISGTSMATPHLSGIAALLKNVHPDWTPSAIKSAIMTTSDILDSDGMPIGNEQHRPATFFDMGAGHVNPSKAVDPGLVYETETEDYIPFLCGLGYNDYEVGAILRRRIICVDSGKASQSNLNYPSIAVSFQKGVGTVKVNRTVTNVGPANSTYKVVVDDMVIASVSVDPETLEFSEVNEKKEFVVTISRNAFPSAMVSQGNLRWISENHVVRSPLYVEFSDMLGGRR